MSPGYIYYLSHPLNWQCGKSLEWLRFQSESVESFFIESFPHISPVSAMNVQYWDIDFCDKTLENSHGLIVFVSQVKV